LYYYCLLKNTTNYIQIMYMAPLLCGLNASLDSHFGEVRRSLC